MQKLFVVEMIIYLPMFLVYILHIVWHKMDLAELVDCVKILVIVVQIRAISLPHTDMIATTENDIPLTN